MALIDSFEVKRLGRNRKEYEVLVRTSSHLPQAKLTDVGFGVSQGIGSMTTSWPKTASAMDRLKDILSKEDKPINATEILRWR